MPNLVLPHSWLILKFLFWVLEKFKIRNHDLLYILAICDGDARRIKRHKKISNICYHHRVFLSSAASYISRVKAFTDGSKKKKKGKENNRACSATDNIAWYIAGRVKRGHRVRTSNKRNKTSRNLNIYSKKLTYCAIKKKDIVSVSGGLWTYSGTFKTV